MVSTGIIFLSSLLLVALIASFVNEVVGVMVGLFYAAFTGSYNVFEPKVIEKDIKRWEKLAEDLQKANKQD